MMAAAEPGMRVTAYYHVTRRGLPVTMCYLQELGLRAAELARQHGLAAARTWEGAGPPGTEPGFWVHTWPPWVFDAAAASMAGWQPPPVPAWADPEHPHGYREAGDYG